mgnify:CR=1 FL=1
MRTTTPGQLMIDEAFPEDMRRGEYDINKKSIESILTELQQKHPDKYREVAQRLMLFGHFASIAGGATAKLSALKQPPEVKVALENLRRKVYELSIDDTIPDKKKNQAIFDMVLQEMPKLKQQVFDLGMASNNPFAQQASSGSRGNAHQLMQLVIGDGLVSDHRDRLISIPILHGYAEGLSPAEYFAGSYGARLGSISSKFCLFADTEVLLSDGSSIRISDIKDGMEVYTIDEQYVKVPTKVVRVYKTGLRHCAEYTLKAKGQKKLVKVTCTPEHKVCMFTEVEGKTQLNMVPIGYSNATSKILVLAEKDGKPRPLSAHYVRSSVIGYVPTFDIEVEHPSHRFVLSNGMVVSNSTQESGFLGKQLAQATHRLVVTEQDCGTGAGVPVSANDPDYVGAVLAQDSDSIKAGTILDSRLIKSLGDKEIYVRSPMTCQAREGVCAKCAGIREKGRLPDIGDNIGMPAAHSISEKVSQGGLCLAIDTLVRMADFTTKKIQDIRVNDVVLGADRKGNTFPVRVINTYNNGLRECVNTKFRYLSGHSDVLSLVSTPEHKILGIRMAWACAAEKLNNTLGIYPVNATNELSAVLSEGYTEDKGKNQQLAVIQTQDAVGPLLTYDIEVDHPDHLFVLANGLIVSNSAKHTGGSVGASARSSGGFDYLNQLIQVPDNFANEAPVTEEDGIITGIDAAPQGGSYIHIGKEKYYAPPGHNITVQVGSTVEAGDVLTDGTPNPFKIVQHKGIGEGRRYFTGLLGQGLTNTGVSGHKRNIETVTRGLINHVKITDPDGFDGFLPDDIVSFDEIKARYQPREGFAELEPNRAKNMYLEKPVLHYSIGTRITPKVAADLQKRKVGRIAAHRDKPPFEPYMIRAMESAMRDSNWMTRMYGSFLGKGFQDAVSRGAKSKIHDTSFIPSLAEASEFGKDISTKGIY